MAIAASVTRFVAELGDEAVSCSLFCFGPHSVDALVKRTSLKRTLAHPPYVVAAQLLYPEKIVRAATGGCA